MPRRAAAKAAAWRRSLRRRRGRSPRTARRSRRRCRCWRRRRRWWRARRRRRRLRTKRRRRLARRRRARQACQARRRTTAGRRLPRTPQRPGRRRPRRIDWHTAHTPGRAARSSRTTWLGTERLRRAVCPAPPRSAKQRMATGAGARSDGPAPTTETRTAALQRGATAPYPNEVLGRPARSLERSEGRGSLTPRRGTAKGDPIMKSPKSHLYVTF